MTFVCSSDIRQRTKTLVAAYARLLQNGSTDEVAPALAQLGVTTIDELKDVLAASLALARRAFQPQPEHYFPNSYRVPFHCLHFDSINERDVEGACKNGTTALAQLLARVTTADGLAFSFLEHSGAEEILSSQRLNQAHMFFAKLSRIEGVNTVFGEFLLRILQLTPQSGCIAFGQAISKEQLDARCVAIGFLAGECMSIEQRMQFVQVVRERCTSSVGTRIAFAKLLSQLPSESFGGLVDFMQNCLTVEILGSEARDAALETIGTVMAVLFEANYAAAPRSGVVSHTRFYSGFALELDEDSMKKDFIRNVSGEFTFSFCKFPFMIDPGFKSLVLQLEAMLEHDGAIRQALLSNLFAPRSNPLQDYFLFLRIERSRLIESTLRELRLRKEHVRRPLRIQFVGEEGIDEGGLKKEFFQLVVKELLDPNYNMFREIDGSRALWVTASAVNHANRNEYFLIGQVLGIAVYNNVILDVCFPTALFRKLLAVPTTFEDLEEVDPSLASGLRDLLNFVETDDVTVEDVYCRTFVYEHEVFGAVVEHPLVPGGEGIALTSANRHAFVDAVTRYVLDASIEDNFKPFREGFHSVCNRKMITEMRPEELEQLVRGSPNLDFDELRTSARYDGYQPTDPVIQFFWDIVCNDFSVEQKKQFLKFCTGSDRVPIRGLKDLRFVIGRNGDDGDMLPTSHTCFNHLLLPAYTTKQKLHDKLLLAISNCQGFGLR